MGFTASAELEALDYDFAPHGESGTIPEPSSDQIRAFRKALADIAVEVLDDAVKASQLDQQNREARRGNKARPRKASPVPAAPSVTTLPEPELSAGEQALQHAKIIASVTGTENEAEIEQKVLHACAAVCSDKPSFDTLDPLPWRLKQAFMVYLAKVFLNPEAWRPATS